MQRDEHLLQRRRGGHVRGAAGERAGRERPRGPRAGRAVTFERPELLVDLLEHLDELRQLELLEHLELLDPAGEDEQRAPEQREAKPPPDRDGPERR